MKRLFCSIIITLILVSCSTPLSKESYLKKYDVFITDISENYKAFNEKEWEKAAKKHDKFSGEWYNKFENDFSFKDQIKIKANQSKWYYYRNLDNVTFTVKQLIESLDVEGLKKQVLYYIDNNKQSDLQKLYEDTKKAGKEAEEAFIKILKELNVKIDELQK